MMSEGLIQGLYTVTALVELESAPYTLWAEPLNRFATMTHW